MEYKHLVHTFAPVFNKESRVLILGSFPSVKSREQNFYYGHPQNRFWKVVAGVIGCPVPETTEEKKQMLLTNHIAVWDVIASCSICGSSDSSIKNVVVNDFSQILHDTKIQRIGANGGKAAQLYERYVYPKTGKRIEKLPSTSPANAAWHLERLISAYKAFVLEE